MVNAQELTYSQSLRRHRPLEISCTACWEFSSLFMFSQSFSVKFTLSRVWYRHKNQIRRLLNTLVRLWFVDWMDLASAVGLCVYISALISGTNLQSIQANVCQTYPDCIFVIYWWDNVTRCDTVVRRHSSYFCRRSFKGRGAAPVNLMTFGDLKPDWMLDCGGASGRLIRRTVDLNQQNVKKNMFFFIFDVRCGINNNNWFIKAGRSFCVMQQCFLDHERKKEVILRRILKQY